MLYYFLENKQTSKKEKVQLGLYGIPCVCVLHLQFEPAQVLIEWLFNRKDIVISSSLRPLMFTVNSKLTQKKKKHKSTAEDCRTGMASS